MESIFSPSWYRVAELQPKLRDHVEVLRHHYRGKLWYVLHDLISGRLNRLTPEAHYIICQMDGHRSFQQIWDQALDHLGDDAPTQEEMIQLLGQLHAGDILLCDVSPDCEELFERYQRQGKQKWKQRFWSPLAQRFPLFDPENFLQRWKFLVSPVFSWAGALFWLLVVGSALVMGLSHWDDLTNNISDRVLAPDNLVILFFVYPVIKVLHEFGHGFATKSWGGEVHEMGFMLLVFMPVPYVDASSSSAFRDKKQRMIVGAAGIMVELFLASLALFVWLSVEPGLVHSIAYNIILIGSVSTLFFNGNPLLRFDGYYIFLDAIEIPNLSSRANNYLGYLVQRYLFGVATVKSPVRSSGEQFWFFFYGIAAFCYRIFIVFSIVLFVAGKFFFIGVVLAIWATLTSILMPIIKAVKFISLNPAIGSRRIRAVTTTTVILAGVFGLLFYVPVPLCTKSEGVVWLPDSAFVRAETRGFIADIVATPNSQVKQGDVLFQIEAPLLLAEQKVLEYKIMSLKTQYNAALRDDFLKAQFVKEEMAVIQANLDRVRQQSEHLQVQSQEDGFFIVPHAEDLPQRWINQGGLLGYVVEFPLMMIRVVVSQDRIGLIRNRTQGVAVRFVEQQDKSYSAKIEYQAPAASDQLPSKALGVSGGGEVEIDPSDSSGLKTFDTIFQFDLLLQEPVSIKNIGQRVFIRFDHGNEPLAFQWYRIARQLFLRQFSV